MENQPIEEKIYKIRGRQVLLDSDLAKLYAVPTFRLNKQVKRNLRRFPPDFMFQLTEVGISSLKSRAELPQSMPSQNAIASKRNIRHRPFAFTEEGVSMLSGVLRSGRAIEVNIAIMRAFVKMRHALTVKKDLAVKVGRMEGRINLVETDVRLLRGDVQEIQHSAPKGPFKPTPRVKGFERE